MNVIECEALSLAYGHRVAVAGASLAVPEGAVYALLGRNGAGKSTLVRGLLGLHRPQSGRALAFGWDTWKQRARIMARVAVVAETPDLPPAMTAAQVSAFLGQLRPGWDAAGVAARLDRYGIDPCKRIADLSRGQRTLAALALALGGRPDLMVLDDPTQGLDPVARQVLYREVLGDLADRGGSVLLTTHDLAGVEGIADRVGVLDGGRLLVDEALEALKARHRVLRFRPGVAEADLAPLAPLAVRRSALGLEATVACAPEAWAGLAPEGVGDASLEQIFVAAVGGEVLA